MSMRNNGSMAKLLGAALGDSMEDLVQDNEKACAVRCNGKDKPEGDLINAKAAPRAGGKLVGESKSQRCGKRGTAALKSENQRTSMRRARSKSNLRAQ